LAPAHRLKQAFRAWLPDGCFSNEKSQFGSILEGHAEEEIAVFYGHLVYFIAIRYILRPFGIVYCSLVYFLLFWYVVARQIWQPCSRVELKVGVPGRRHIMTTETHFNFIPKTNKKRQTCKSISDRWSGAYLKGLTPPRDRGTKKEEEEDTNVFNAFDRLLILINPMLPLRSATSM
jgi:hypothetical protein